jgi:succinate dehydrogenase / fumarate reductase, cytochrome b subunit
MSSAAPTKRDYRTNTLPTGRGVLDWLKPFFTTSVGMKATTALTGLGLTGFVVVHLIGNLQVLPLFGGREAINAYAQSLKDLGPLLWIARGGLLAIFVLHVYLALTLAVRAKAARPVAYHHPATIQASTSSVTMPWTGLALLAFILFHLAHYTFGMVGTTVAETANGSRVQTPYLSLVDDKGRHDVYSMVLAGFHNPYISVAYIVCMVILYVHLSHGIGSVFQSLGLNTPRTQPFVRYLSRGLALALAGGNIAIVIAVWAGAAPSVLPKVAG